MKSEKFCTLQNICSINQKNQKKKKKIMNDDNDEDDDNKFFQKYGFVKAVKSEEK